ncbi:glycosyltransferase family 4 protein [Sodalis sp. RH19]|uniref:glycosyltransferase family 4 protein n=1 Tax=Sodalis sp. RH19 TaxID=3394334 RepID=UPI0039B3E008
MAKIKVLHISDEYEGGGAESVFRDTISTCEKLGFENEVYYSDSKISAFAYVFSLKNYKALKKIVKKFQPNIIHIHNYYHYLTPSILYALRKVKREQKFKVIFTAHDYHLICPNSGLQYFDGGIRRNFDEKKNNISYRNKFDDRSIIHSTLKLFQHKFNYGLLKTASVIDTIISPSYFLRDVFHNYGISIPIKVIRNPISLTPSDLIPKVDGEPKKEENKIKLVFFGRLSKEKGVESFLLKLHKEFNDPIELHIFGNGPELENLTNLKLNKNINIIFHGYIERVELNKLIRNFDIFILPSIWYENAPISIIEAAFAGLPCLVTNQGGLKEMASLTEHFATFDYENDNISELINGLILKKSKNYLLNEDDFTYDNYEKNINKLYLELHNQVEENE